MNRSILYTYKQNNINRSIFYTYKQNNLRVRKKDKKNQTLATNPSPNHLRFSPRFPLPLPPSKNRRLPATEPNNVCSLQSALLLFSAIERYSHRFSVFDFETFKTADPFIDGGWTRNEWLVQGCFCSCQVLGCWRTGSKDGTVRIWEVETGRCLWIWDLGDAIEEVAWSPLPALSILAVAVGLGYVDDSSPTIGSSRSWKSTKMKIQSLLEKLLDINDSMSRCAASNIPTTPVTQKLDRHREILHEFTQTSGCGSPRMQFLRERAAIHGSIYQDC